MTETSSQGAELLPHIVRLSEVFSECLPYAWGARRYLYSTLFVRAAYRKKQSPQALSEEFEKEWKANPPSLFDLLPDLVNMYRMLTDPDWSLVQGGIDSFYRTYRRRTGNSASASTNKVPQSFRPLPSLYHSVRNEIQKLQENIEERKTVSQELLTEIQGYRGRSGKSQFSVRRKYVKLVKTAGPAIVWDVKHEAFMSIFQRTRELFQFQSEEAHFYHAAAIIDFWYGIIEGKHRDGKYKDAATIEKEAADLKKYKRIYVEILESAQNNLEMDEMVKFVTDRMKFSPQFISIRNVARKDYQKSKKFLGESTYVLPALVESKASLASSLYKLLHERRKEHDELVHITDKIKKQLQEVQEWERKMGTSTLKGSQSQAEPTGPSPVRENCEAEDGLDRNQELIKKQLQEVQEWERKVGTSTLKKSQWQAEPTGPSPVRENCEAEDGVDQKQELGDGEEQVHCPNGNDFYLLNDGQDLPVWGESGQLYWNINESTP